MGQQRWLWGALVVFPGAFAAACSDSATTNPSDAGVDGSTSADAAADRTNPPDGGGGTDAPLDSRSDVTDARANTDGGDGGASDAGEGGAGDSGEGGSVSDAADGGDSGDSGATGDGGDGGSACSAAIVSADGGAGCSGDGGCPLLVTDTAGTVYALNASGGIMATYSSPVQSLRGVVHDPALDGFWVSSAEAEIAKVDWTGALVSCYKWSTNAAGSVRGLGFSTAGIEPQLEFVVTATARDAVASLEAATGSSSTTYFIDHDPPDGGVIANWGVTRDSTQERYVSYNFAGAAFIHPATDSQFSSVMALPGGIVARGIAAKGTGFYVVDSTQKRLVEVDSAGAQVGSFALPGTDPADVSYGTP